MTLPIVCPPAEVAGAFAAPETPGCAAHAKRWVLSGTVLASSVVFLEATVINVALPAMQTALGAPVATMQWIASTYTLALAALTLVGGALGDRLGRRRLLIIGLSLFSAASLVAGLAPNAAALIVARVAQGCGAALVAPNSLAQLSASFPRAERGRALGLWSAASALTGGAAPLLGGWLVDVASWRAVFLLGLPPALVALGLIVARVPESRAPHRDAALDLRGAGLAALAFAALTGGLISTAGPLSGTVSWSLMLAGAVLLAGFIASEARSAAPLMPLALFRSRAFSAANLLTLFLYFAISATTFLLPFVLVQAYGYSATLTGLVFLPFAVVMGTLSRWAGGLVDGWGAKWPLVIGPLLVACGLGLFANPAAGGALGTGFLLPMTVVGLGMAMTAAPLTMVVMGTVPPDLGGVASGINNTVARLAALLAVAVTGVVALTAFSAAVEQRVLALDLPAPLAQAMLAERRDLGDASVPAAAGAAAPLLAAAVRAALVDAFRHVATLSAILALCSAFAALLWIDAGAVARAADDLTSAFICEHLAQVVPVTTAGSGCEECLRTQQQWVHLRLCLGCGHVGCCDASANHHATRHFRSTGHPIVQSLAPGESWRWCYLDEHVV
ncbi:MAG: MFS transporter [bacterium]